MQHQACLQAHAGGSGAENRRKDCRTHIVERQYVLLRPKDICRDQPRGRGSWEQGGQSAAPRRWRRFGREWRGATGLPATCSPHGNTAVAYQAMQRQLPQHHGVGLHKNLSATGMALQGCCARGHANSSQFPHGCRRFSAETLNRNCIKCLLTCRAICLRSKSGAFEEMWPRRRLLPPAWQLAAMLGVPSAG